MKDSNSDHLPHSNTHEAARKGIPVPPAQAGGVPVGRQLSLEDPAGNLRFHVACSHNGDVNVHIPWSYKTMISRQILQCAHSTLEDLESDAKFKGGAGCGLLIHSLAECVTGTVSAALTFLPRDLPGDKPVSIYVLCAFTGNVNIHLGTSAASRGMDEITLDFLARLDRDKHAGSHHARQIVDDYVAEVTANLIGGVARSPETASGSAGTPPKPSAPPGVSTAVAA